MSITALASKLYTIKSRKNVPLSSAFGTMVREDLAMRLSVYNLVRIVTRSEFLATVAQAKYGKQTPLEKEEAAKEKKRRLADMKFKQFTVGSIANLNNRINGLSAITERNTALIANLYAELGAYRNKKIPTLSALSSIKDPSAVRFPVRNKTIKAQLDMMREQLASLSANNKPFIKKASQKQKEKKEKKTNEKDLTDKVLKSILFGPGLRMLSSVLLPLLSVGVANAGIKAVQREVQRLMGRPEEDIEGANPLNEITDPYMAGAGALAGGYLAYKLRGMYKRFTTPAVKAPPTPPGSTPAIKPAPPAPKSGPRGGPATRGGGGVIWNAKAQRWQQTTGRRLFVKGPRVGSDAAKTLMGETSPVSSKATRIATQQNMPSSRLPGLIRRLPPGVSKFLFGAGRVLGTGPQTIALLMQGAGEMASGRAGEAELAKQQAKVAKFGIKFIRGADGTPIYEINGKQYTSETLPPEYQVILDAYVGDQRAASSVQARKKIAENPKLYNSLIVQGTPLSTAPETNIAAGVIAAAKAAQLTIPEPKMIGAGKVVAQTPVAAGQKIDLGTIPSVSYTPGQPVAVETVKQIIVNAANIVGVDPGIMLAMGKQESTFDPNAIPINKKTGKVMSSAKGLYQFIDSTWQEMVKKYAKDYPQLNNGPFDPLANALAGALYVKENSAFLKRRKIPITGTSIYATHFLGPGGAAKLFGAPVSAPAVEVFKNESKSNPWVFKNKDGSSKTIQEVIDYLYKQVGRNVEVYTAQLKKVQPPPMMASASNVAVVPPPPVAAASQAETPAIEAQVNSIAALSAVEVVQRQVNTVAEQVIKDRRFNQVDDASVVNTDMANYGLA
jgi:hypothetical protein